MASAAGITLVSVPETILTRESEKIAYKRRFGQTKHAVKWGQRKLLLSEIQFLNYFWDPIRYPRPVIVYAGAAPGTHIAVLLEMFPTLTFQLYDTNVFSPLLANNTRVTLHARYFTDDEARRYHGHANGAFFISDIRTANHLTETKEKVEDSVWRDMQAQERWANLMNPVESLLKFRLPYVYGDKPKDIAYLNGLVFLQVWPGQSSSETRLVPSRITGARPAGDSRYEQKEWDAKDYEDRMMYHNSVRRETFHYENPLVEGKVGPIAPPELLDDFDSAKEVSILMEYFVKGAITPSAELVLGLSRYITSVLNPKKTLAVRRAEVA